MKKNHIFNVSLGLLVTIILFIITILFVPALLPDYLLEGSIYYVSMIFLEALPLCLGLAFYLLISKDKLKDLFIFSPAQFRENKSKLLLQIIIAMAMAVTSYTFVAFTQIIWLKVLESIGYQSIIDPMPPITTFPMFLLGIVSISLTPAILEELIFRGMFQKGLLRNKSALGAIMISSSLFMLMHGSLEAIIYTFVLGAIIGYIAYSSGSIIPSIAYHAANNAMAVIGLYISGAFPEFFGLEEQSASVSEISNSEIVSLILPALISLVCMIVFLWLYRKVSIRPPKNPNTKPIPASSKALILISVVLLLGMMGLIAATSMMM